MIKTYWISSKDNLVHGVQRILDKESWFLAILSTLLEALIYFVGGENEQISKSYLLFAAML